MEVYGQIIGGGYERLATDPTGANLFRGRFWHNTTSNNFKVYDGTSVKTFADLDSAQTFQNKVFVGMQISDFSEFVDQGSTPSNPAAGRKRVYAKADGFYQLDSLGNETPLGGGGGGSKNYFSSVNAEIDSTIGDWTTDDGVGGVSAGLTLAVTAVAGELLAGANSLKLSKDAADRNGHFIKVSSEDIDPSDRGRINYGSFEFRPLTGYVAGDLIFEVYDLTNAAVLYSGKLSSLELLNTKGRFSYASYLESTTASVEFRIKVNNTNTNAFAAVFDEFKFGPKSNVTSAIVTPMTPATNPDSLWNGTIGDGGIEVSYRRVGDSMEIEWNISFGAGTTFPGEIRLLIPDGKIIDKSKSAHGGGGSQVCGTAWAFDNGSQFYTGQVIDAGANYLVIQTNANGGIWNASNPFSWSVANGDQLSAKAVVPIQGWEAGNIINEYEASLQSIYVEAGGTGVQSIPNSSVTKIDLTVVKDSHAGMASSVYTAQKAGFHLCDMGWGFSGNPASLSTMYVYAFVNGSNKKSKTTIMQTGATEWSAELSLGVYLEKGDTVEMRGFQNSGAAQTVLAEFTHFSVIHADDLSVFGVVKNNEYLKTICTTSTETTSANVWTDCAGMELPLTPGEWDMGYDVGLFIRWYSGTSLGIISNIAIFDASNNLIADTIGMEYTIASSGNDFRVTPVSKNTRITVPVNTTYKLRIRCSSGNTFASTTLQANEFSGSLTGDDNHAVFWARRVK